MMALLSFKKKHEELEAEVARAMEVALNEQEPAVRRTLLEINVTNVERVLQRFEDDAVQLEAVIAEHEERLRQTRISIEAFSLALRRLTS